MPNLLHTAEFLHLFSIDEGGLKYLTHDYLTHEGESWDYVKYIYDCQRIVLKKRLTFDIQDDVYNLVRGFLFGPHWYDSNKNKHNKHASSEAYVEIFEQTHKHPLNDCKLEKEIDDFRHSIRFRSLDLEDFFDEIKANEKYANLNLEVHSSIREADFYTHTRIIKEVISMIIDSMREPKYSSLHPNIVISFLNQEVRNGFQVACLVIEQRGSHPSHKFKQDRDKLRGTNSGTLGTIKKKLTGLCEWSIVSKWADDELSRCWEILTINGKENDMSLSEPSEGFKHILKFYHKL